MSRRELLTRLGAGLLGILGAMTLIFALTRLSGDPAELMSPPGAPQEQIEQTRELLGLNEPLIAQYVTFVSDAVTGDLGESYYWREDVRSMVLERVGATAQLALGAIVVAVVVGVPAGLLAAFHRSRPLDRALVSGAMLGQAVPSFWLAPVLVLLFAVDLGWFPVAGRSGWSSFVLPVLTLATFQIAVLFRVTRAAALETLGQDHVKLARAKGASPAHVARAHVAPNSMLPVMTVAGLALANLIGGSVIVEVIFGWPGLGNLMVQAVSTRDFPLIQGIALVIAIGYVVINTVVDVLYRLVDPRLRQQS